LVPILSYPPRYPDIEHETWEIKFTSRGGCGVTRPLLSSSVGFPVIRLFSASFTRFGHYGHRLHWIGADQIQLSKAQPCPSLKPLPWNFVDLLTGAHSINSFASGFVAPAPSMPGGPDASPRFVCPPDHVPGSRQLSPKVLESFAASYILCFIKRRGVWVPVYTYALTVSLRTEKGKPRRFFGFWQTATACPIPS